MKTNPNCAKNPFSIPGKCLGRMSILTIAAYKADETNSPTVHVCASSDKKTHEEYITAAHTCKPAVSLLQFSAHLPLHLYDGLAAATANRRQGNLKNRPAIQDFQSCTGGGGEHRPRHSLFTWAEAACHRRGQQMMEDMLLKDPNNCHKLLFILNI